MKNQSENAAHRPQPIPPTGAGVGTRRRCTRLRLWPGDLPRGSSCECCHTENRGHDRRWGTCFTAVATWRVPRAAAPRHVATSGHVHRWQLPCYCCISALAPGCSYGHCIRSPEPVFPQRKWSGGPHVARAAHGARGGSALSVTPGHSASASVEWFLFTFPKQRRRIRLFRCRVVITFLTIN